MDKRTMGLILVAVGIIGLLALPLYTGLAWNSPAAYSQGMPMSGMMGQWSQQQQIRPTTLEEAKTIAWQYLASLRNPNMAIREIMEFRNNFYITYYEKDTGIGAFEMLIWKQAQSDGMMGGGMRTSGDMTGGSMMTGTIVPEPGPNMMWNTKYSMMRGMMGPRWQPGASSQMPVSEQDAKSVAENSLSHDFPGAHVEGITRFYGYYTIDFEKDGRIVGMMSVNGYSGRVWYHSWHGAFIQETELD